MEKISRTKIVDLLKREDFGAMVNVKGWVRTRRGSKQVNFIALNDGSTINNVQIVVDLGNFDEEMLKEITQSGGKIPPGRRPAKGRAPETAPVFSGPSRVPRA